MLSLLGQLFKFGRAYGKYWMIPLVLVLLVIGGLIVIVAQSSAVAPFIYALF